MEEVDPRKMKHEEKLAFWINVHNVLVMHVRVQQLSIHNSHDIFRHFFVVFVLKATVNRLFTCVCVVSGVFGIWNSTK